MVKSSSISPSAKPGSQQPSFPKSAAAGADAIYCACNAEWASALLSLPEAPHQQLPFLGESHFWANHLVAELGALADGVYFSSDYPYALPATRELAARYKGRFGAAPHSPYFATAYDAYQLLLDAIQTVGELNDARALRIDRAALNAAIRNTSDLHRRHWYHPLRCKRRMPRPANGRPPDPGGCLCPAGSGPCPIPYPTSPHPISPPTEDLNCGEIWARHGDANFWDHPTPLIHPAATVTKTGIACERN